MKMGKMEVSQLHRSLVIFPPKEGVVRNLTLPLSPPSKKYLKDSIIDIPSQKRK